jgi:hypothetical protein
MRDFHSDSPLHHIERWNGTHFSPAHLWQVGTYLLVQHHTNIAMCETLTFQTSYLESFEREKDKAEQENLQDSEPGVRPVPGTRNAAPAWPVDDQANIFDMDMGAQGKCSGAEDVHRGLWDSFPPNMFDMDLDTGQNPGPGTAPAWPDITHPNLDNMHLDDEDAIEEQHADEDIDGFNPYLPEMDTAALCGSVYPTADALNNTYVRVVHTNGIHHLAMVTCNCQGEHGVALDLVASRFLPASFSRIRTLFSTQALDYFRLCNLELKASVYQFYQLLRRLTMPNSPTEVVNLYHEFRRMSRVWRWMKKLKWAGYGHMSHEDNSTTAPGALANFCPACPQPGINLPDDWENDTNRFAPELISCSHNISHDSFEGLSSVGCLWPMATSKLIMCGKRNLMVIYGFGTEVEWRQTRTNITNF